jgi:hypothetical protein
MKKIPVGATIAHAYRFAFLDFFKILGVMWLPMAILWLPGLFMKRQMMALSAQMGARNFSGFREMLWFLVPFYLVALIFIFMQIIGIAQLALGRRSGPAWFYFSLGKPVWRLIGSFLLFMLACIIGWLAALLGDLLIGYLLKLLIRTLLAFFIASPYSSPVAMVIGFLAAVILIAPWCGLIYCAVRLSFLLTPVVAAQEDGLALARSWILGLGNFWRMFAVLLVVFIPFLILEFAVVFGFLFKGISFPPPHASAAQLAAYQAALNAQGLEMMNIMFHYWYICYPITIAVIVVFYGMSVGAQCFAYRTLTDGDALAPVAGN